MSARRAHLAVSKRWRTNVDLATEKGQPWFVEQLSVSGPLPGVGEAAQAEFVLKASDDPVGAGLAFVDGPLNAEETNGVMLLADVSGRIELVSIADGLPAAPGFGKALVPRTIEFPEGSSVVRPNVAKWLRLGRPEPNLWSAEVSEDGIHWSTIGDDLAVALEPTSCAAFMAEWPYTYSSAEVHVRGLGGVAL